MLTNIVLVSGSNKFFCISSIFGGSIFGGSIFGGSWA
jgi:hypothetical protein